MARLGVAGAVMRPASGQQRVTAAALCPGAGGGGGNGRGLGPHAEHVWSQCRLHGPSRLCWEERRPGGESASPKAPSDWP